MLIVCYAVNGSGIGHLKRLTGIARQLKKIAKNAALPLEIIFLTSSEASHLLYVEGFPSFKFPSREILARSESDLTYFSELIKNWTRQILKLLQPDLLLVDTFPSGYYQELPDVLSFCRQTAIIHRPLNFDNLDEADFYKTLGLYDLIVIPEEKSKYETNLPIEISGKTEYFGAVMCREKEELFDRATARKRLRIEKEEFVIYISAGGGGDEESEKRIFYLFDAVSILSETKFVIGAGALYRGRRIFAPNVIWLENDNAFELMKGFDLAISAAGYNSYHELLFAGVPTIFIPQRKWADDQFYRSEKAVKAGAAFLFGELPERKILRDFVERLRDRNTRRLISQKARNLVSVNYALPIARYLLEKLYSNRD